MSDPSDPFTRPYVCVDCDIEAFQHKSGPPRRRCDECRVALHNRRCVERRRRDPALARARVAASKAKNPDAERARHKLYYEKNKDRYANYARIRRARKVDAMVHDVPDAMVWEFNPAGPGLCNYCRVDLDRGDRRSWHVDHVVPISRGGLNEIGNLVVACARCNVSKGARTPEDWSQNPAA
jgi:5-methylcytosine-specific restriction endonuclease McrA